MSQNTLVIADGTGAEVLTRLSEAFNTVASLNSGSAEPAETYPFMWWADTTAGLLKIRNSANTGWIEVGDLASANLGLLTAFNPSYTGTFTGGTGEINIGSGQLVKDSSGNVGIGTSSPSYILQAVKAAANTTIGINNASGNGGAGVAFLGSNTTKNFFIGNQNNVSGALEFTRSTANGGSTFTTPDMVIDSSGNLLVGTTSIIDNTKFNFSFTSATSGIGTLTDTTATSYHMRFKNPNGVVGGVYTNGSNTTYTTSSDYRLKENIQPMTGALNVVQRLNPVTFNWKVDGSDGQGFIAHELQAVVPDCVGGEKDAVDAEGNPVYQGVDTSFLVATLTAAIQELKAELDATKAEVAALKATN